MIWHELEKKLESSLLQTIKINEEDVVWMDKHEIWVNEHMFDIHTKKLENGIYTFTGLYDEQETDLVNKYKNTTEKNSDQNQILSSLFQLLQSIYNENTIDLIKGPKQTTCYANLTLLHISSPFKNILTPPPQA